MGNKTNQIAARISEDERKELNDIAEILDVPEAQIVREAVREKMVKLRKHPKVKAAEVEQV